jgi:hypothetical protein
MAYYIFLKSLRSLEEFRKNPHVKIPPKSPCANFQSLDKFKNPIFNSKFSFLCFRPGRPCGPLGLWPSRLPLASLSPQAETSLAGPSSPCIGGVSAGVRFPFWFTPSELVASLSSSLSSGPRLSAPSLTSDRPSSAVPPPPPGHPALPSSAPRVPPSRYHPAIIPPPP